MYKSLFPLAVFSVGLLAYGQSTSQAKALLDEVYNKITNYTTMYIEFTATLENAEADLTQKTQGMLTISGEKYVLNYVGAKQLYDGKKRYTIVPENQEVTIETTDEAEDVIGPSQMLTFYRTGHTYAWDALQTLEGRTIQYIKLAPMDSNTAISSILLGVDMQTKHIYNLIQTGDNGTQTNITIDTFKTNLPVSQSLFTFNEQQYQDEGYYIVKN